MHFTTAAASLLALAAPAVSETVVGVYVFHRHGDRTPKALPPANLTDVGYQQVYQSGQYYRSKYVQSSATSKIQGLNTDLVKLSQIAVTAPVDNVLQNSAAGFLQGLYPPVGSDVSVQTLANGTNITAPLNGYQLIPVNIVSGGTGSGSEDNTWLQDASGCANAKTSSNNYFSSAEYQQTLNSTQSFYESWYPVVNRTFAQDYVTFKNAYSVWDLVNVATIHNASIQDEEQLSPENLFQLRTLADAHEFGLAYNATDNARAMVGMQLAGEVVSYLNSTITSKGSKKLGVQFGAYATFLSFFGLANLTSVSSNFTAVVDYASSIAFELYSESDNATFPATDDLRVRFYFSNGTATAENEPQVYPLFGQASTSTSWNDFATNMNKFAVHTAEQWCTACGNTTGTCAAYAKDGSSTESDNGSNNGSHGMSAAVGGVIGAMVTLAVILGLEAIAMLAGGFRLIRKNRLVSKASAAEPKA